MLFRSNDTATTEIYTLSYTTLFRSEAEARRILAAGYDHFRRKNGQVVYEVLGSKLCKVVAPEGTIIELRDTAEL